MTLCNTKFREKVEATQAAVQVKMRRYAKRNHWGQHECPEILEYLLMICVSLDVFGQATGAGYRKGKTRTGREHPHVIVRKPSRSLKSSDIVSTSNKTEK